MKKVYKLWTKKVNPTKGIIYVFKALNTDLTLHKLGKAIDSKTRFKPHNSQWLMI